MEDAMENLLVGKENDGEDQEQWKAHPGPSEQYDDQYEGDP